MDTCAERVQSSAIPKKQRRSIAEERRMVEETLAAGASVARVAPGCCPPRRCPDSLRQPGRVFTPRVPSDETLHHNRALTATQAALILFHAPPPNYS